MLLGSRRRPVEIGTCGLFVSAAACVVNYSVRVGWITDRRGPGLDWTGLNWTLVVCGRSIGAQLDAAATLDTRKANGEQRSPLGAACGYVVDWSDDGPGLIIAQSGFRAAASRPGH
ncbi:uncharacterized protein F5Z01DRAFT_637349 [Emericellopsis atlantica]|uniref:Uncharacterized protein n=1 Tax=Emericellopsis atlantica TaxID=2614577 RepID=A0A9P8CNB3_9HYPO|nr:uncharacterized protein F5Z01DRAFT_637349 [Emericellopsis atlantica]KAG9253604.1 hypothetical protein F5Z01DRAFT_637349 [Emericellopsis atlantica]